VIRDDDQPTPGAQTRNPGFQSLFESVRLVVDGDSERLEDERRWVVAATAADSSARNHGSQIGCGPQRRTATRIDDRVGELSRTRKVGVISEPLLELIRTCAAQQVCGRRSRPLVHAHVERRHARGFRRESKAALG
jgi:hypothetical protein